MSPLTQWEHDHISSKEGWSLFNADGVFQIQAIDELGLMNDTQACDLVAEKALAGSKVHALALYLDGQKVLSPIYIPKPLAE